MDRHVFVSDLVRFSLVLSLFGMVQSCDQASYPVICRDIALKLTLKKAHEARTLISSMDFNSLDERAKMAWGDCLELYEDTIHLLNQTIDTNLNDVQTYLSASITNHETCKNGFMDLNLTSHLQSFPSILTNFSKSLSNMLAINRASSSFEPFNGVPSTSNRRLLVHGFPSWVTIAHRKLLQSSTTTIKPNLVVAKDGSGDYKTISEAIIASKNMKNSERKQFIIYVKGGVYHENVVVTNKMKNLMLIGDGIDVTIVTSNKNVQDGSTTFRSATVGVSGDGFMAKGITFENTAGPQKHQAVALRSGSDFSIFYQCSFKGYQDTLYVYSKRQFYKECDIYGTIDFIFGDAVAVLQTCKIYARKPMSNQKNTITAQARSDPNENTGIVIHDSIIDASPDLKSVEGSIKTFLGRPWQKYSRTVVMKSVIGRLVDPAGWTPWSGDFGTKTLYYAEYMNTGPGSGTNGRVKWSGYHIMKSLDEASKYTVRNFLAGDAWIPATQVPFTSGL